MGSQAANKFCPVLSCSLLSPTLSLPSCQGHLHTRTHLCEHSWCAHSIINLLKSKASRGTGRQLCWKGARCGAEAGGGFVSIQFLCTFVVCVCVCFFFRNHSKTDQIKDCTHFSPTWRDLPLTRGNGHAHCAHTRTHIDAQWHTHIVKNVCGADVLANK